MTISELPENPEPLSENKPVIQIPETGPAPEEARRLVAAQIALALQSTEANFGDYISHCITIEKYLENGLVESDNDLTGP